jgi:hypothetical protein
LDEFEKDKLPNRARINEELETIRPHHLRFILNHVLKESSTCTILSLLPYFLEKNLIDKGTLVPVVIALMRSWIQSGPSEELKSLAEKLRPRVLDSALHEDLNLMIDVCSDKQPTFDHAIILRNDCFDALVSYALRHSDFKQLASAFELFPKKFIHSSPDVFQLFLDCIKPGDTTLVGVYLSHLSGQMITGEEFEPIKKVFRLVCSTYIMIF